MHLNLTSLERPQPFQPGTIQLWDSPYIAEQVLKKHLNGELDSGSRKRSTIETFVDWLSWKYKRSRTVLDVGCGPGLYAPLICAKGFQYEGFDISPYQIDYARQHNNVQGKTAFFVNDLRMWNNSGQWDLALMLYGIYSFYPKQERISFLKKLYECINYGGSVVVEVFTRFHYYHRKESSDWEYISKNGFWKPEPYLELNAFRRYDSNDLILIQAVIIDDVINIWNSWIETFTAEKLKSEMRQVGFNRFEFYGSCLGESLHSNSDVLVICAQKL